MPEPPNPYESPADGDASGEFSSGWIAISTHRVFRWPVGLVVLVLLTVILLTTLMAVASMLIAVVGKIGNLLMIVPLLVAGFALLTNTKRIMSRYDRIPARCPRCSGCAYRTKYHEKPYRCVQCGYER